MLRDSASLGAGALLAQLFPGSLLRAVRAQAQQAAAPAADPLAAVRAQLGTVPIQTQKLADNLTLLSGPGGNVVVLNGADGKFVVDTFLAPAWPRLKESLLSLGDAPLKLVIDTHWHFDHTDNNAPLHAAGATILAHANTKKRMSEVHDLPVLGLHFPHSPADALPPQTSYKAMASRCCSSPLLLRTQTRIFTFAARRPTSFTGETLFSTASIPSSIPEPAARSLE
jgi:hypothetical protein